MKFLTVLMVLLNTLYADVYYARVEPFHTYAIKSAVSGKVMISDIDAQGTVCDERVIIQIDDKIDQVDLKNARANLANLEQSVAHAQKIQKIKKNIYRKVKSLSSKSSFQKDAELITYLNAQDQVINLQTKVNDLRLKVANLKDRIAKKKIVLKGLYIYEIHVEKGDYVNPSTPLLRADDLSKARVNVYLSKEDVALAKTGSLYINDKKTPLKFSKIWNVADAQNISAYRAELIIDTPKGFSQLLKIEVKK